MTGDEAAIHRFNEKTTKAISNGSMQVANGITEPVIFLSTMSQRSKHDNIKGVTYYGLKGIETYLFFRLLDFSDEGQTGSGRGPVRLGSEEILPNGQRGVWVAESTAGWSKNAIEFQESVTGVKPGLALKVNDVRFDGFQGGVLLDAKSSYDNFVNSKGEFHAWFRGKESLVDEATRQLRAANGTPISWEFKTQKTLDATKKLFESRGINGINFNLKK